MHSKSRLIVVSLLVIVALVGLGRFIFAAPSFIPGDQPTGTIAPLAVTNFNLTSGNEIIFKTDYEKENWWKCVCLPGCGGWDYRCGRRTLDRWCFFAY